MMNNLIQDVLTNSFVFGLTLCGTVAIIGYLIALLMGLFSKVA